MKFDWIMLLYVVYCMGLIVILYGFVMLLYEVGKLVFVEGIEIEYEV